MTTLKDLKRVAKNVGLKGYHNMKKDDLQVAIVMHMQQTGQIVNPYAAAPPMKKTSRKRRSSKRKASRKRSRKRRSAKRKVSRKLRSVKRKVSRKKKSSKRKASRKRSRKRRSTKRCPPGCVKQKNKFKITEKGKRKWCTAKVASQIKTKTKCKERGCEWGINYKLLRKMKRKGIKGKTPRKCNKISSIKRILPGMYKDLYSKKNYCNKYRTGYGSVDKRACNRDPKCKVYLSQVGWGCGKIKKHNSRVRVKIRVKRKR